MILEYSNQHTAKKIYTDTVRSSKHSVQIYTEQTYRIQ